MSDLLISLVLFPESSALGTIRPMNHKAREPSGFAVQEPFDLLPEWWVFAKSLEA